MTPKGESYSGPVTVAIPLVLPIIPKYSARRWRGRLLASTSSAPGDNPPDPTPAIALPSMRPFDVGVTAHTSEPISNNASATMYVHFVEQYVYIFPKGSVTAHVVRRYALAYQERSPRELNCSVILGTAVARTVLS